LISHLGFAVRIYSQLSFGVDDDVSLRDKYNAFIPQNESLNVGDGKCDFCGY
jgi:hypothetical protein